MEQTFKKYSLFKFYEIWISDFFKSSNRIFKSSNRIFKSSNRIPNRKIAGTDITWDSTEDENFFQIANRISNRKSYSKSQKKSGTRIT